jgi:PA domain/LVIVD repeat
VGALEIGRCAKPSPGGPGRAGTHASPGKRLAVATSVAGSGAGIGPLQDVIAPTPFRGTPITIRGSIGAVTLMNRTGMLPPCPPSAASARLFVGRQTVSCTTAGHGGHTPRPVRRAVHHGAVGVIVFNNPAGGEGLVLMGGDNPVLQGAPSVIGTAVTIPGFFVQRSTGLTLAGATPPVTALAAAVFDGWGFMRIFDTSDPANPVQLAEWHSPGTDDPVRATEGTFTIHNPEVRGNQVLTSWYNEGFFVIDISNPSNPRDIGQWAGEGAPAGAPVNIWSVVPHGSLLLASDRNFGLYVLKLTP